MNDDELKQTVDDYLTMLTDCLSEQTFVRDYNAVYGIENDLDTIAQISPDLYPLHLHACFQGCACKPLIHVFIHSFYKICSLYFP